MQFENSIPERIPTSVPSKQTGHRRESCESLVLVDRVQFALDVPELSMNCVHLLAGSTLNHWPFPSSHLAEAHAYLLTHPGTPCVFYDHFADGGALGETIKKLLDIRRRNGINARSKVSRPLPVCCSWTAHRNSCLLTGACHSCQSGMSLLSTEVAGRT